MCNHRSFALLTAFALTACLSIDVFSADYYVDTVNGNNNNDGLSPASAVNDLNTGYTRAYNEALTAGTNEQGYCSGASSIHLLPGSMNLKWFYGEKFVEGNIDMIGEQGAASDVWSDSNIYIATRYWARQSSPLNGTLLLRNINFRLEAQYGCLSIARNDGFSGSPCGELKTEGGSSFSWSAPGGVCHIGVYNGWNDFPNDDVDGSLVFGEGTTSASMLFKDFLVGYRLTTTDKANGLVDGRAVTGGSLVVSNTFYVGKNGQPGVGNVLLGEDWTVHVGSGDAGNMVIGKGANTCSTTGIVSFASGGLFTADVNEFSVGYGEGNSDGDVYGYLLGGEEAEVSVACSQLRVGYGSPKGTVEGLVDFSESKGGALSVTNYFSVGCRSRANGKLLLGEDWNLQIGRAEAPINEVLIGFGSGCESATGLVSMASGSFAVFANTFKMACEKSKSAHAQLLTGTSDFSLQARAARIATEQDGQQVYGEIDAGASMNAAVDLETLYLGYGNNWWTADFFGRLALGHGVGTVGSLYMGVPQQNNDMPCPTSTKASLLELNGFRMAVTNALEIRTSAQVQVSVNGMSSGLSLASDTTVSFRDLRSEEAGPAVLIDFSALPEGMGRATASSREDILWGLKWEGDHVDQLNAWINSEDVTKKYVAYDVSKLDASAQAAAGVFYDEATDATYIGLYVRKQNASSVLFLK